MGAQGLGLSFPAKEPCILYLQPKGADRKQKTDREKMEKRTAQEKEKYQPSYETTILTEVSCGWGWCTALEDCQVCGSTHQMAMASSSEVTLSSLLPLNTLVLLKMWTNRS